MTTTGVRHSVRSARLSCRGAERKVHSAKYTEVTGASGAREKHPILTDVLQKKKTGTHTQREREVERKTVPHRLSDCLCTCAGDSSDPFVSEMCSCANPVI